WVRHHSSSAFAARIRNCRCSRDTGGDRSVIPPQKVSLLLLNRGAGASPPLGKSFLYPRKRIDKNSVCGPTRANGQFCQAHLERAGIEVPATVIIADEPMCKSCYRGLPLYPSKLLLRKRATRASARTEPSSFAPSTLDPRTRFTVSL